MVERNCKAVLVIVIKKKKKKISGCKDRILDKDALQRLLEHRKHGWHLCREEHQHLVQHGQNKRNAARRGQG